MTCIVGVKSKQTIWLGADAVTSNGHSHHISAVPKVFRKDKFLIGICGSWRMGQLLEHAFKPPKRDPKTPVSKYMATSFIDALRKLFKKAGFAEKKDDHEKMSGLFMVGYRGHLFVIYGDYQVHETVENYSAIGSGEDFAYGSLFATKRLGAPEQRIELALQAAEYFCTTVRGPFTIKNMRE